MFYLRLITKAAPLVPGKDVESKAAGTRYCSTLGGRMYLLIGPGTDLASRVPGTIIVINN